MEETLIIKNNVALKSNIGVIEVLSHKELKKFIEFPFSLYKSNPYWVPPIIHSEYQILNPKKKPAFQHCEVKYWLAYRGQKVVGRIAGIINDFEAKKSGKVYIRFGWLDFINDFDVSTALFSELEMWAISKRAEIIHGPLGFTDMDKQGMLIEGFEELGTLATIYNYSYYPIHLERLNYEKKIDWVEYDITIPRIMPQRLSRYASVVAKRYDIREAKITNKKQFKKYAQEIFNLVNISYKDLYGFIPLTEHQVRYYTEQYSSFIQPAYSSILLNSNNQVVAFLITMPSFSKTLQRCKGKLLPFGFLYLIMQKVTCTDGYLIGVLPKYQNKGLHAIMIKSVLEHYIKVGITKTESGIELETNTKIQSIWKLFKHRIHKKRRCFIKKI